MTRQCPQGGNSRQICEGRYCRRSAPCRNHHCSYHCLRGLQLPPRHPPQHGLRLLHRLLYRRGDDRMGGLRCCSDQSSTLRTLTVPRLQAPVAQRASDLFSSIQQLWTPVTVQVRGGQLSVALSSAVVAQHLDRWLLSDASSCQCYRRIEVLHTTTLSPHPSRSHSYGAGVPG